MSQHVDLDAVAAGKTGEVPSLRSRERRAGAGRAGLSLLLVLLGALPVAAQTQSAQNHVQTLAQKQALAKLVHAHDSLVSGVQATTVPLVAPAGLAYDAQGDLFLASVDDNVIRKVDVAGMITTVAGTGEQGFAGDGGLATAAVLDSPMGVAVDGAGNVYVADADNQRVRVLHAGVIATVAGDGEQGFGGDTASATRATLDTPRAAAAYGAAVAFADAHNDRARAVNTSNGLVATVAGLDASSTAATLVLSGQASLMYGVAGSLTATLANQGSTATGKVTLLEGATVLGVGTLSANAATVALPVLSAGAHSVAASYAGDGTNPATTSGVFVLTVGMAGTTTSLSVSSGSSYVGAAVTLTARVTSVTPGVPSGTVAFLDGTSNVGVGAVQADGTATLKLATLGVGSHTLTAVYGATANYGGSTSAAVTETVLAVPDFTLTAAAASQTVMAGGTASFGLTVAPSAAPFASPISFTVTGLPAGATVGFSPNGLTPNGASVPVTMTVVTSPLVAAAQAGGGLLGMAALVLLLWPLMSGRRPKGFSQVTATLLLCLGVGGAAALTTGCGSSAAGATKSYVLTVTATATSVTGSPLVHTATVNLTVQ